MCQGVCVCECLGGGCWALHQTLTSVEPLDVNYILQYALCAEEELHPHRLMESKISALYGPLSTLVIACAGAGVLAFPFAMYRAGLVLGVVVTIALGAINLYSMRIITRMSVPVTRESPHFATCLQRYHDIGHVLSRVLTVH